MTNAPTAPAPVQSPASIGVSLDVQKLAVSCEFYRRLLGFEMVSTAREGMIYETRVLRSPRYPGVELTLREAFGRRVGGSQCGGLLSLAFPVGDAATAVARLATPPRWVNTNPALAPTGPAVKLFDPDGYVIELRSTGATE